MTKKVSINDTLKQSHALETHLGACPSFVRSVSTVDVRTQKNKVCDE